MPSKSGRGSLAASGLAPVPVKSTPNLAQNSGPLRDDKGHFLKGQGGRRPGAKNCKTQEIKEIAAAVLLGPNPQASILRMAERVQRGDAPHLEKFFAEHLWGKPKETLEINLTQKLLVAVLQLSDLELAEFLRVIQGQQPEQALRLLPGGQDA
jgi:hypothetical protein